MKINTTLGGEALTVVHDSPVDSPNDIAVNHNGMTQIPLVNEALDMLTFIMKRSRWFRQAILMDSGCPRPINRESRFTAAIIRNLSDGRVTDTNY